MSGNGGVGVSVVGIPQDKINSAAVEAAAKALVAAMTNGLCVDRWPRSCSMCDCFRDGNAGPGCNAFTQEVDWARCAVLAAVPYIEAEIRAKIAADVTREMAKVKRRWHEQCRAGHDVMGATNCSVCKELDTAARVARGTQEATNG